MHKTLYEKWMEYFAYGMIERNLYIKGNDEND